MKITLIEWSVIITIISIIIGMIINPGRINNDTVCKAGYVFAISSEGPDIQIINDNGTGIKCN